MHSIHFLCNHYAYYIVPGQPHQNCALFRGRGRYGFPASHRRSKVSRPRPRAVWHKLYGNATHLGDVERKAGVRSTLSTKATRSPVGFG